MASSCGRYPVVTIDHNSFHRVSPSGLHVVWDANVLFVQADVWIQIASSRRVHFVEEEHQHQQCSDYYTTRASRGHFSRGFSFWGRSSLKCFTTPLGFEHLRSELHRETLFKRKVYHGRPHCGSFLKSLALVASHRLMLQHSWKYDTLSVFQTNRWYNLIFLTQFW